MGADSLFTLYSTTRLQIYNTKRSNSNMASMKEIDEFIANNKVAMISKSYCPFCTKAKRALNAAKVPYKVLEIENRADCQKIQDYMLKKTKGRSVPRVFIDGKFIGGGDDVARLQQTGQLAKMCQ